MRISDWSSDVCSSDLARTHQLDRWRRCAVFLPGAMFCRIRWQANDYGTIRWQLMVMQACTPLDAAQRIPGVQPGARLLLHAEGENQVRAVLERSEEHTSELQSLMRISYAVFCLKKKNS